ncbi:DUF4032 domain-containing protein [Saccharospirillum impatiens]|uniref:DUF4032 domain-containing protein n=1 Tax=Saccharospirillum impatiens TaxID=169438 RepID=UPI0003FC41D8|nr:DUF4032 domain-containing protein [Saccharospirillum impatiens]
MKIQIHSPSHYITDLRYPWSKHLSQWPPELFVEVARGIHRNVVRFISNKGRVYALKELMTPIARNEYNLLREMEEMGLPVVEPVGLVTNRDEGVSQARSTFDLVGDSMDMSNRALLVTHYLEGALPYRIIIQQGISQQQLGQMLDALVELLARLHLSGIYWGDCSLSNTLFRRDAGLMAAYLVDAETSEIYPTLSDGQRAYDLELAELNLAGDLMDLEAAEQLPVGSDPVELANSVVDRYNKLWQELTHDEIFEPEDQFKIEQRVRRLNDLGFDVEEMEITTVDDGQRVRMVPRVVEHWHHRRRLNSLTGLQVQENQARRLLNDLSRYKAFLAEHEGREVPEPVAAYRWLSEVFNPSLQSITSDLKGSLDDAEVFHEILEHRWYLSQAKGRDVGQAVATEDYINTVLQRRKAGDFKAGDDPFVKTIQR